MNKTSNLRKHLKMYSGEKSMQWMGSLHLTQETVETCCMKRQQKWLLNDVKHSYLPDKIISNIVILMSVLVRSICCNPDTGR